MKITEETKIGEAIHARYSQEMIMALRSVCAAIKGGNEVQLMRNVYGSEAIRLAGSFGLKVRTPEWIERFWALVEEVEKSEGIEDPFGGECSGP